MNGRIALAMTYIECLPSGTQFTLTDMTDEITYNSVALSRLAPCTARELLRRAVRQLVNEGKVVQTKGNKYCSYSFTYTVI